MWTSLKLPKRNDTVGTVWRLNIKVPWDVTFWGAFCRQTFLQDRYRMWWHYFENEAYNPECCILLLHQFSISTPTWYCRRCRRPAWLRASKLSVELAWLSCMAVGQLVGLRAPTSQRICCMCIFSAFLQNHGKTDWPWLICVCTVQPAAKK